MRGRVWLAAVLVAVLLIVVLVAMPSRPSGPEASTISSSLISTPEADWMGQAASHAGRQRAAAGNGSRVWRQKGPAVSAPEPTPHNIYRKDSRVEVELNSADSLDLVQLYNIGPAFAKRILKYRALLGGFVDKRQLWEVYGMDSVRYNDVAPYVTVDAQHVVPMDINGASVNELKHHPYLDYYQAKAIVRFREEQGPYNNIGDLHKVALIDNETFNKISPYLVCNLQQNK